VRIARTRNRGEVAQSAQKNCAEAILDQNLPRPGSVTGDDVDGQWARVRLSDDTMFLAMFAGGWRVVGAGLYGRVGTDAEQVREEQFRTHRGADPHCHDWAEPHAPMTSRPSSSSGARGRV
jgi:hypothetical protein